jgi:hypothetical protein
MYNINLYGVILSVDNKNQTHVLSIDKSEIVFPKLDTDKVNLSDPQPSFFTMLKEYFPDGNELEFGSQLIKLHCSLINPQDNTSINTIYGFVVDHYKNTNNCYWIPFSYVNIINYSSIIFEVIQKLK